MTVKYMMKKLGLNREDYAEIEEAVKKAEEKTDGEICVAIAAESSSYAFWELACSVAVALLLFAAILPESDRIYSFLSSHIWGMKPWFMSALCVASCVLVSVLLYFFYNIPAIDSRVIPQGAKDAAVSERAMTQFAQSGVYLTKNHSGVLVYISWFEHQVRIVADRGIGTKISQDLWNLVADELAENLRSGKTKEAILGVVERCGNLLEENFPATEGSEDELSNAVVILENRPWL